MKASDFMSYKNWIVVGDVENSYKYANRILVSLKIAGFNVKGVNPRAESSNVYKSLKEVPYEIEVLDLCINPKDGINIIKEAKELNINNVLIQPGAESEEILDFCIKNQINAIEGCALVELSHYK